MLAHSHSPAKSRFTVAGKSWIGFGENIVRFIDLG